MTPLFHPSVGGQQTRFLAIGSELVRRGHSVDVLCIGYEPGLLRSEDVEGIHVERFPFPRGQTERPRLLGSRNLARVGRVLTIQSRYMVGIRRRLRSRNYDWIYFNQYPLVHVLAAPRRARRRSAIDWCELRDDWPLPWAQRWLPRVVQVNFCVQEDIARSMSNRAGVPVHYLPVGAFLERYSADDPSERTGWLYVGRWYPNKRLPLLIESWAAFRETGGRGTLTVVGDGPAREDVLSAVGRLPPGLSQEVLLPGAVTDEAKLRLLASASLLVLTSDLEGFPNVVVEAMASSLPILTVDEPHNGTSSVVRSLGIGQVAAGQPSALAEAAHAILRDWDCYSARARQAAAAFHWEQIVDRFLSLLPLDHRPATDR